MSESARASFQEPPREFQITIDCAQPGVLARFWATLLRYQLESPPEGFKTWNTYWRHVGVPEDELGESDEPESIVDPTGRGPRVWFQQVPEGKVAKNRLHLDVDVSEGRTAPLETRREQVDEAAARAVDVGGLLVRQTLHERSGHYAIVMQDSDGNEFCLR